MDPQEQLTHNVHRLMEHCISLEEENATLRHDLQVMREELIRNHGELTSLQSEHRKLQTAHALTAESEQRDLAKRQITRLIDKIDKVIGQLQV